MRDYFESGPGREAMGDAAPVAVKACEALAAEVETVAASLVISGDVSDAGKFARDWAREHPIQHSIGSRESTVSRVTERRLQEAFSTQEIAGMGLMGLGGLIAIVGGILFVYVMLQAILRGRRMRHRPRRAATR